MFSVSKLGGVVLAIAATVTCSGCSEETMVRLDIDGDGVISRSELFAAVVLSFCSEDDANGSNDGTGTGAGAGSGVGGTTTGAGSGSPTGTGFSDPLTDGN